VCLFCSGRSSDFPAFLAAFPFRFIGKVAYIAKKVPFIKKGGITAAGPLPILTGFPIKPLTGTLLNFLKDTPPPVKAFFSGAIAFDFDAAKRRRISLENRLTV
jgi:hypothetical protein